MFDIGSIVNSIANQVLPGVVDGGGHIASDPPLAHEPAHAHLAQPSGPLSSFVATNGLHSIATAHSDVSVTKKQDCASTGIFL